MATQAFSCLQVPHAKVVTALTSTLMRMSGREAVVMRPSWPASPLLNLRRCQGPASAPPTPTTPTPLPLRPIISSTMTKAPIKTTSWAAITHTPKRGLFHPRHPILDHRRPPVWPTTQQAPTACQAMITAVSPLSHSTRTSGWHPCPATTATVVFNRNLAWATPVCRQQAPTSTAPPQTRCQVPLPMALQSIWSAPAPLCPTKSQVDPWLSPIFNISKGSSICGQFFCVRRSPQQYTHTTMSPTYTIRTAVHTTLFPARCRSFHFTPRTSLSSTASVILLTPSRLQIPHLFSFTHYGHSFLATPLLFLFLSRKFCIYPPLSI